VTVTNAARRTRIATFAIIGVGLVLLTLLVFGTRLWHIRERFIVDIEGTAYGLERGGDVYFEGVRVGNVAAIEIDRESLGHVRVTIAIDRGTPINIDTKAFLLYAGVTGVKEIDLRGGTSESKRLPPGSRIEVGSSEFDELTKQAHSIANQLAEVLTRANGALSNISDLTGRAKFGMLVERGKKAVDELASAGRAMRETFQHNNVRLAATLASLERVADSAQKLIDGPASDAVVRANSLVARLDDMVRGNAGQVHAAIAELQRAGRWFAELARDLRAQPSRILFSQPAAPRRDR
jgi:phospholipid/cholesterol/gamma-HCH transport system substrate-binding protein